MQAEVITAKQIHEDFYGAEERLFVEAIGISKGVLNLHANKADRLKKIGFGKAKPIKDAEDYNKKKGVSEKLIAAIEYFRVYYPQYKFITEVEVKRLCEKYGLLLGDASNFIGDMPEKNLVDIENFKLRNEDWKEKPSTWYRSAINDYIDNHGQIAAAQQPESPLGIFQQKSRRSGSSLFNEDRLLAQYYDLMQARLQVPIRSYITGVDPYKAEEKKEVEKEQPPFKICAPKEDFNTFGYEVKDGYRLVWDPVVLQPVLKDGVDGYLIVTAWGDEASDELVVNQTSN